MSVEVLNGCEINKETRNEEMICEIAYPRPERVYPHALLVQLKEHPVAQRWPPYLDPIYRNARGVWDPDRWHHDRKRGDTPVVQEDKEKPPLVSGGHHELLPVKRPREKDLERVNVLEEDSIVLSPQRRSFLTGCQASQDDLVLKPEQPGGGRRVGSGRILARESTARPEEFPLKPPRVRNEREVGREPRDTWDREGRPGDRDGRPGDRDGRPGDRDGRPGDRDGRPGDNGGAKFGFRRDLDEDRRSFYQHDERDIRGQGDRRMMGSGMAYRGRMGGVGGGMKRIRQETEPEWMNESVSISDVIELRGFDEPKPALQPGMSLEELEQRQQKQQEVVADPRHQYAHQQQQQQQRPASRASTKSDKEIATVPAGSRILTDFLKAGREAAPAADQSQTALPDGLLESIMGGQGSSTVTETGGFNFDSIMMESVIDLSSLLGSHHALRNGGDISGNGKSSAPLKTAATQPQQQLSQQQMPEQKQQQSRFSQFFNKSLSDAPAPPKPAGITQPRQQSGGSRRSSIQDELLAGGANILRELNGEATIRIPSPEEGANNSSKYFTPISPAAKTAGPGPPGGNNNLLEMLQKSGHQQQQQQQGVRQLEDGIKRSLGLGEGVVNIGKQMQQQQLGANHLNYLQQLQQQQQQLGPVHHQSPGGPLGFPPHHLQQQLRPAHHNQLPPQHQSQDSDMSAFKKLVAQVKGLGPPPPCAAPTGDAAAASLLALVRQGGGGGGGVRLYTEQDLLEGRAKGHQLPQQQQRPRFSHPAIPPPLLKFLETYPWNLEVLKRPDAEHLIMGLNSGTFSLEHIVMQLSNPALQGRQRELILNVLKLKTSGLPPPPLPPSAGGGGPFLGGHNMAATGGPSGLLPPRSSPLPGGHHYAAAHHGGRGVSPLMGGVFPPGATNHLAVSPAPSSQRVPSPQEMTVLTQQIMQQALIKRKLEEQKENYRRRQGEPVRQDKEDKENFRGVKNAESGSASGGGITGSPLAFTPTSVMRKNAAERKDSDPRLGVPELKIGSQERGGRPERQAPPSPGRPITKGKTDRPGRLELSRPDLTTGPLAATSGPLAAASGPLAPAAPGLLGPAPGGFNPLLFLQNSHMRAAALNMDSARSHHSDQFGVMDSGASGGGDNMSAAFLAAAAAAGVGGNNRCVTNATTPSTSRPPHHGSVVSGGGTPLARFFSPDVLAAAHGGACPPMPALPIRQALTLEEIERQAAAAAVRI